MRRGAIAPSFLPSFLPLDLSLSSSSSSSSSSAEVNVDIHEEEHSESNQCNAPIAEAQEEALRLLRFCLNAKGVLRSQDTDADLARFLKARAYDTTKARMMYEAMVEWRKEIGADTIIEALLLSSLYIA